MSTTAAKDKVVLVVDDEEDVRFYLMDILEDAGFEVMSACDGVEALERVKEKTPDLISLDLVMPNKSGIRFLHELRRSRKWQNIPVVIVTAHAHDDLGRKDFNDIFGSRSLTGPKVYLEKPVQPNAYANLVCESLGVEMDQAAVAEDKNQLRDQLKGLMDEANADELAEAIRMLRGKK